MTKKQKTEEKKYSYQEKPSALKREHPALQKCNLLTDTETGTPLNPDPIQIHNTACNTRI
jgi:hypothetical protein